MAKPNALFFFLLLSISFYAARSTAATTATNFIKSSCSATRYPALCVQSLAAYASTIKQSNSQLARAALAVSLSKAQATKDFVTRSTKLKGLKAREVGAIRDCLEVMGDSVDRLAKSMDEMRGVSKSSKGQDFIWHMSNVQTWVSAALTDENTCVDGFSGKALDGHLKASIRARILGVAQVTSNALALVNRCASNP